MAITSAPKRRALALRPTGRRLAQVARELATPRTLLVGGALVIVGYLAVVPLVYLLHDTFTGPAGLSIGAFTRAYSASSQAGRMMLNSLEFAVGSGALALAIGTLLAYVQVRTDAPLKGLFFAASLVPLIIPGILYAAAWIFLADPRIGLINVVLFEPILGHGLFNTFSMWGMIWVQGLHLGAPRHLLLRRITMPLVRPAIVSAVLLMFVQSLESFEVPGLLGLQNGIYVFTSRIYFVLRQFPIDYGAAGAYALGLLAFAVAGVAASGWLSRNARSYQTVTGKAFRPRPMELGRARPLVGALVVLFFAVAVVLPVAVLVYASLLRFYSAPSLDSLRTMSLANYRSVLHTPLAITALRNSVVLGVGAATVVMFLTAVCSWVVVRTRAMGRRLLDVVAFTPLVVPGLVLGLALSFVYLRTALPIYGTLWILLIAYATRYLPYGMRYASAAMSQTSGELEESAHVCGASWWQTFRRVLLPLASSGILAGWVYILVVSFRELSSSILLYSPGKEVLSILIWEQFENGQFTTLAAIGVCMVAILVLLVLVAYRLGARFGVDDSSR